MSELHNAKFLGINQIHTLPTASDVQRFVPSKVDQILKMNPSILEGTKGNVDAVTQKQIGKAFIFYRGTFAEREAIMLSSDVNYYDEVDKSDQAVIRDYNSRMSFSQLKRKRYLSTPTIPDFGISRLFNRSDQKYWRFNCPKCGHRQHLEWEKNVDFERKIYVCQKCNEELSKNVINSGEWEAKYPSREISGYWISQMMATYRSCAELIKEQEDADDDEYFYNFILGLPYLNPESKIPGTLILKNLLAEKNTGDATMMGVDVGKQYLHIIGGNEKGVFMIIALEDQVDKSKWDRLSELMDFYNTRYCVIDGEWDTNTAYEFARRKAGKVYLAWYKSDPKNLKIIRWGDEGKFTDKRKDWEEEVKVLVDRNRSIDLLVSVLRKGKIRFNFQSGSVEIRELINHIQTMYVRTVTDKYGQERREWASTTGNDHFLHALNLFIVAMDKKEKYEY